MPWRLILFIIIFALFLAFITINLGNQCDIHFGFTKLEAVPVFLTVFISFVLGLFSAFPLVLHIKKANKYKLINELKEKPELIPQPAPVIEPDEKIKKEATEAKKRFFAKRQEK